MKRWTRVHLALSILSVSAASIGLSAPAAAQPMIKPRVIRSFEHDPAAFTQGLVLSDGKFYESTGLRGRSSLRRVLPSSGVVELQVDLPSSEFGEGLALAGDQLIQITWQEHVAHVYSKTDFKKLQDFAYEGEGWGLCYDGTQLVMSDGSSMLTRRRVSDFSIQSQIEVTDTGVPVTRLNELECVGRDVYANVWQTRGILQIDGQSGEVLSVIDASGLLTTSEAANADVLNGIAYDPATKHFYVTGKLWPKVFEVELPGLPRGAADAGSAGSKDSGKTADAAPSTAASSVESTPTHTPEMASSATKLAPRQRGCACDVTGARSAPDSALSWMGGLVLLGGGLRREKPGQRPSAARGATANRATRL